MNDISNFITTVGFPIALAVGLLYGIFKVVNIVIDKIITAFDRITLANEKLSETNKEVVNTNKELTETNNLLAVKVMDKLDIVIDNVKELRRD